MKTVPMKTKCEGRGASVVVSSGTWTGIRRHIQNILGTFQIILAAAEVEMGRIL